MSRREIFSRTRGRLLPTLFLTFFLLLTLAVIVVYGFLINHGFPNMSKGDIFIFAGMCPSILIFGLVWNWKWSLDILFKSTKIFSGNVILGERIYHSKIESGEGAQWELIEKNGGKSNRKFKIYSDRMGLNYPSNKLPADLCAGPVTFRYMKRSKYIVEIIQMDKD